MPVSNPKLTVAGSGTAVTEKLLVRENALEVVEPKPPIAAIVGADVGVVL